MLKYILDQRPRCPRCGKRMSEYHYWCDGTYECICTQCKEEMESGGVRRLPEKKEEGLLV